MPNVSQKDKSCFLPYFTELSLKQVMFCGLDAVFISALALWLMVGNIVLVCNSGRFPWRRNHCPSIFISHSVLFVLLIRANKLWIVRRFMETVTLARCSLQSPWFSIVLWLLSFPGVVWKMPLHKGFLFWKIITVPCLHARSILSWFSRKIFSGGFRVGSDLVVSGS